MKKSAVALVFLILAVLRSFAGIAFHPGAEGIDFDAGSLGAYSATYPQLLDAAQQPVHKLLEHNAANGKLSLKYDGGAELELVAGDDGKLAFHIVTLPVDVKGMAFEMHLPIAFNQGGKWRIGETEGDFPKVKPPTPHLFQDHARLLRVTNYEGRSLSVQTPEYSFLQLTDNREWNWSIFNFRCTTPLAERRGLDFTITIEEPSAGDKSRALVDEFGQSTREDWPQKVKNLDELKADVAAEATYYANLRPPELDSFGGLPGSRDKLGLKGTGFFHVEQKNSRWLLVDPAGNAFFHLGACGVNPSEDYTQVKGRESAYQWLPEREGEFASAFNPEASGTVVSFQLANMIRKYGQPYDRESYTARMIGRLRKWGFNSIGAFSQVGKAAQRAAQYPTVAHLPIAEWEGVPRLPSIGETFDPFDETVRARIEANCAKVLPSQADDPLIIGYFIVNEPIYENIPHMVPTLNGTYACKRRLVQWLQEKYKTIEDFKTAWKIDAASFDELKDRVLNVATEEAKADVHEFTGVFFEEYFRLISETFRRYDKNHLLLGCRLQPGTINNEQLCRIAGKYLDVMSFNYYTNGVDRDFLRRIYGWTGGKPMIMSEFFWGAAQESGLAGGRELATQQERGLAYRNYVEQTAALGFVVGIEWFTLIDQSVTGRWFQGFDGERANTGLIAVTDRPWTAMLNEMMKTNYEIYPVWLGEREPFAFNDPRFKNAP